MMDSMASLMEMCKLGSGSLSLASPGNLVPFSLCLLCPWWIVSAVIFVSQPNERGKCEEARHRKKLSPLLVTSYRNSNYYTTEKTVVIRGKLQSQRDLNLNVGF